MVLGRCGGGRVRLQRRRQRDASSDPLALRDRVDEIGGDIAQQFAIYEELASLLWLHYAGLGRPLPTGPNSACACLVSSAELPCFSTGGLLCADHSIFVTYWR